MTATDADLVPVQAIAAQLPGAPQYITNFEGMGTEAFPESVRKVLAEPVDPAEVEIKPDGICYMPGYYWRRQLNKAFGPGGWGFAPRTPARVMGNIVVWDGVLIAMGRIVATAVGECAYRANNSNMSYASCVEGAKTDAIGRCCKDLGIGWELHDPKWRRTWQAQYAEEYTGRKRVDGQWTDAKMWRLKSGKLASLEDRARGAGGEAHDSPSPATAVPRPADQSAGDQDPAPAGSEEPPAPIQPHVDSGEAASAGEYDAVVAGIRRLKWRAKYVPIWLEDFFGASNVDSLTREQVATAMALLAALTPGKKPTECPAYVQLVSKFAAEGRIKS